MGRNAGTDPPLVPLPPWSSVIRAIRGDHSTFALSAALGFESNVVAAWQAGRRCPAGIAVLRLARQACPERLDGLFAAFQCEVTPPYVPESEVGLALLLNAMIQGQPVADVVGSVGLSRHQVGRWLRADAGPNLEELLTFAYACGCSGLVLRALSEPGPRAPKPESWFELEEVLGAVRLARVQAGVSPGLDTVARVAGLEPAVVARHLSVLEADGAVQRVGERWTPSERHPLEVVSQVDGPHAGGFWERRDQASVHFGLLHLPPSRMLGVQSDIRLAFQELVRLHRSQPVGTALYWMWMSAVPIGESGPVMLVNDPSAMLPSPQDLEELGADMIRRIRGERTQRDVADALGVGTSTIGHWENGRRHPPTSTVLKLIAHIDKIRLEEL